MGLLPSQKSLFFILLGLTPPLFKDLAPNYLAMGQMIAFSQTFMCLENELHNKEMGFPACLLILALHQNCHQKVLVSTIQAF